MFRTFLAASASIVALASPAHATDTDDPQTEIVVNGQRDKLKLDRTSDTGSRLGLSVRETPATVETLTQADMQVQGLRTAREAFNSVVGAIAGNVPGNPAVVTLRGFSGGAVSILQDGVRVSTSTVVQRDTNVWHYDRIDVIKGPASVLYGEGALAGVINKITRKPTLDGDHLDGLLSIGSFATVTAASGVNLKLSDTVAIRADASYLHSDSLYDVDDNATRSTGLTASILLKPAPDLSVLLAVDHYEDRYDSSYQGLPFVSAAVARDPSDALRSPNGMVLDKALRRRNYNPAGAYSGARDTTLRSRIDYAIGSGWSVANDFTWYHAKRDFVLSGDQVFTAPTPTFPNGSFARSIQRIYHDHRFWNERVVIANDGKIAGLRNRFSLGGEYNDTNFTNPRQQGPIGGNAAARITNVDPYAPVVGIFPTDAAAYSTTNVIYQSKLKTASVFAEDALNLTPGWLLVGGARYDHIDLTRVIVNLNANGAVTRGTPTYDPFSWRIGTTYDLTPDITVYGQYTTAVTPVSSILLQSIVNTGYKLTKGRAYEVGFKASAFAKRLTMTGAAYRIEQSNILTRDPTNPQQTVQGGEQSSQGVELSIGAAVTDALSLSAGAAYTDANYDQLSELIAGARIDRAGNRPINTPSTTVSGSALYTIKALPVTLGGFVRHVSGFYTDTANTYFVRGHTVVEASVSYQVAPQASVSVRGRNLTNAFYGEYSGYPTTNVYIGAPRSVEIALSTHF
ncbi:iron complex outermembrane receptor protein [Sphingomonas sp. PP-CE-3G-477]|uniref:TonB-dependent receptor n=1 Tax=Sphingomonas sp. PP-CE-3G-477 TaxID=2135660 RepID=UPI000D38B9CF|nr:TonB-dependent siderophore receptor [Sphingomonas sp. PP-CE-3G-477]PTQ64669.1 iron complex outermembrane receptor protein [Sphingomonas sp. PP-CE-3G-477]